MQSKRANTDAALMLCNEPKCAVLSVSAVFCVRLCLVCVLSECYVDKKWIIVTKYFPPKGEKPAQS